jgi:hypothetical protein
MTFGAGRFAGASEFTDQLTGIVSGKSAAAQELGARAIKGRTEIDNARLLGSLRGKGGQQAPSESPWSKALGALGGIAGSVVRGSASAPAGSKGWDGAGTDWSQSLGIGTDGFGANYSGVFGGR